jgi:hypothetical protein
MFHIWIFWPVLEGCAAIRAVWINCEGPIGFGLVIGVLTGLSTLRGLLHIVGLFQKCHLQGIRTGEDYISTTYLYLINDLNLWLCMVAANKKSGELQTRGQKLKTREVKGCYIFMNYKPLCKKHIE